MNNYLSRTVSMIGENSLEKMSKMTILVIGLGGVGGTALEALYRSGFRNFILVDSDIVDETNLNRQIMYSKRDIGVNKVDACKAKLTDFCGEINVKTYKIHIDETNIQQLFINNIDYVVDAIDYVPGKIAIYDYCIKHNIPFISSLGMAKRFDPEKVFITTLNKTENDPLAKKIRYECRQQELDLKKITVVFSKENPIDTGEQLGSMIMVPSTAGLLIAKYIITSIK